MSRWAAAVLGLAAYNAGSGDWRAVAGCLAVWAAVRLGLYVHALRTPKRRSPKVIGRITDATISADPSPDSRGRAKW